ncbi:MAG: hypothetical protein L3J69_06935 [Desulfobacula sp.]|nr:hypothetical protein [Desulfobacula sp.]
MKRTAFSTISFLIFVVLSIAMPVTGNTTESQSIKTVAILAFGTNAQKDISYITDGILSMLHSRIFWKNKIHVIRKDLTTNALANAKTSSEYQTILQIGKLTHADYVISGIVTEFSGAFSIDTKVYDLKQGAFFTFSGQSKSIEKIISRTDIVAAKINKKVFARTTISYENFKNDKIITEEELRRMNPERMMPVQRPIDEDEKPWWKIW